MRRLARWGAEDEGGQAVVELALSLPILLLVLLGMAQLGLMLNTKQRLEGVAAQAARAYAITADAQRAIDVLRIAGEPLERFSERSTVSLIVSRPQQRTVVEQSPRTSCTPVSKFSFFPRCTTVYETTTRTITTETTSLEVSGRLASLRAAAAPRNDQRGQWVAVSVTYLFPNPIRPTFFQLPATFPLTTRAVARVEVPKDKERDR
ncbi:MAG: pilus assembly protein [Chloroflexi bacterium]|nr:pilus assembly protein [Chloroflexota bacterium]